MLNKVMAANRGEIAIRIFRACTEMGIRTVAIYSYEDRLSLHRYKADEAYVVGKKGDPVGAYLDAEGIVELALAKEVKAIHPGYGFLAENPNLARLCQDAGITFVGPSPEVLELVGDKMRARKLAKSLEIPVIPGTDEPVEDPKEATAFAKEAGFPIIIKAASGGGGRGMRIVYNQKELLENLERAQSEALKAFGDKRVFLERFIEGPKHIEVQVLGDKQGNIVHLFERDCSIQRRHQKMIELAPAVAGTDPFLKERLYEAALRIARGVGYQNAGTVEFLVDKDGNYYFIEMNPRIQVEHTVTEQITGRDLVQAQLKVASGLSLHEIGIRGQESVKKSGFAVQCRVTTEDPNNNFMPDTGRIVAYRTAAGYGVRLDAGDGFIGARISPHYDPLLVKVTTWALTFSDAVSKMERALSEFRIRGIKTNIPFLLNVLNHPTFMAGKCNTTFVDTSKELFQFKPRLDRGNKTLRYLGDVTLNGFPGITAKPQIVVQDPPVPSFSVKEKVPRGTADLLRKKGPKGVVDWLKKEKRLLVTDTSFRDAHQSNLTTRVRTYNMARIADATARLAPQLFSIEMWGGATFDVAMRFLHEDPWQRIGVLKKKIPNILFQMLLRGSNAVGYTNYPDNVVRAFVRESAKAGIDLFRIFDCFNWIKGMEVAVDEALKTGKLVEVAICYTGDLCDPKRSKYDLNYYVSLAKEIEAMGAHMIGIKDMAGLCKPQAAKILVSALKDAVDLPIHYHTHDTAGNGVASCLRASEAGVDVVDLAISSLSGLTAQPSMEAVVAALHGTHREPPLELENLMPLANYWEAVREFYAPFESGLKGSTGEVYFHEIPGGQYSNLKPQVIQMGLGDRWQEVKEKYAEVNRILGDIVKVTPSSKVVGDLALFMLRNNLSEKDLYEKGKELAFPDSVVGFFKGLIGQPTGGFNEKLRDVVLKGEKPIDCRPGELLEPVDLKKVEGEVKELLGTKPTQQQVLSYVLYPKVFQEFVEFHNEYGDVSVMKTPLFFYGMEVGQEESIEIEEGKTLIVKLNAIGELLEDGTRVIHFELNGQPREVRVPDHSVAAEVVARPKADPKNPGHVGSTLPGKVIQVTAKEGARVKKGDPVVVVEAMKMETNIIARTSGTVSELLVQVGDTVSEGDLLAVIEEK